MLGILFFILWGLSVIIWIIYTIKTIKEMIKNGDYIGYLLKMNIALVFMLLFNLLEQIF